MWIMFVNAPMKYDFFLMWSNIKYICMCIDDMRPHNTMEKTISKIDDDYPEGTGQPRAVSTLGEVIYILIILG